MLELGLVVVILAVVAVSVSPALMGSMERMRFGQTVRAVSNLAASASRMAVAQKCVVKMQYDASERLISLGADSQDVDLSAAGDDPIESDPAPAQEVGAGFRGYAAHLPVDPGLNGSAGIRPAGDDLALRAIAALPECVA